MKSRAKIINGRWQRRVPWKMAGSIWRTDMFKTVLSDQRLTEAEFICVAGPRVMIHAEHLRRVLPQGPDHYGEQIWGPFNIDLKSRTIAGHVVPMTIVGEQWDR